MYDAWGNCTISLNTNGIASLNPIRYRGYYYDTETGLYYLNARYYSPEWRRFISPDAAEYIDPETPNGLNLYAYCNNDPVNYADPSGHSIIAAILLGALFGAVIGFGATVCADYIDDGEVFNGSVSAQDYVANTLVAGVVGGVSGGLIYTLAPAVTSFLPPLFPNMIPTMVNGTAGTAAVAVGTVTGAQIVGGAIALGLGVMFMIPMTGGTPNSVVKQGGSTGTYDENGNLISRQDTTGKPHFIKELGARFLPHTHIYKWEFIKGAWRIVRKIVLPY